MRWLRITSSVAAALLAAAFAATPASADTRYFSDPRGDTSSSIDLLSVRVDNSTADPRKVVVVVRQVDVRAGDGIEIFVDTRPADHGPEYSISGVAGSEYLMRHREHWKGQGPPVPLDCGYRLRVNEQFDRTRAVMSRACLGRPGDIRVAVRVNRGFPATSQDWAKARRTWLGSVGR
jgi:hypothetical protein